MSNRKTKQKQKMRGPSRPVDPRYSARRVPVTKRADRFVYWLIGISMAFVLLLAYMVSQANKGTTTASPGATTISASGTIGPLPTMGPAEGTATAVAFATETSNLPHISVDDLKTLVSQNNAKIVDVRAKADYDKQHIKGAINVPKEDTLNRIKDLPKEGNLVVYCQ